MKCSFHHQVGCHTKSLPALVCWKQPNAVCSILLPSSPSYEARGGFSLNSCIFSVFSSNPCLLLPPIPSLLEKNPPKLPIYCSAQAQTPSPFSKQPQRDCKRSKSFPKPLPPAKRQVSVRYMLCLPVLGQDCKAPGLGSWPPSDEQFPVEGYSLPVFRI